MRERASYTYIESGDYYNLKAYIIRKEKRIKGGKKKRRKKNLYSLLVQEILSFVFSIYLLIHTDSTLSESIIKVVNDLSEHLLLLNKAKAGVVEGGG